MNLRKVRSGQKLSIPAGAYNAFIDAAADYQRRTAGIGQKAEPSLRQAGIVLIRNDSGSDQNRLAVLGIDSPIIGPTSNEDEFKNRVALSCVTPAADTHEGRFVILLEPIAVGKIGRAYAAGICPARVQVKDEDHWFADVKDGETSCLESRASGAAQILWKEAGTGLKWAIVRLSAAPAAMFPVLVTKDGGEAGDADTNCSFTYTVQDIAGVELGTTVSPQCRRLPKTEYTEPAADSPAVAYFDASGDLQLYHVAGEIPVTDEVEVITSFRYDTVSHKFQLKKTAVRVLEKADEDAAWTDVVALTECDDT